MLKNQDIIILALPRWDGKYKSTSFNIARELARQNRIIFVDNPFTFKDVFKNLKSPQIARRLKKFFPFSNGLIHYQHDKIEMHILIVPPVFPLNFLPKGLCSFSSSSFNGSSPAVVYEQEHNLLLHCEHHNFFAYIYEQYSY